MKILDCQGHFHSGIQYHDLVSSQFNKIRN